MMWASQDMSRQRPDGLDGRVQPCDCAPAQQKSSGSVQRDTAASGLEPKVRAAAIAPANLCWKFRFPSLRRPDTLVQICIRHSRYGVFSPPAAGSRGHGNHHEAFRLDFGGKPAICQLRRNPAKPVTAGSLFLPIDLRLQDAGNFRPRIVRRAVQPRL